MSGSTPNSLSPDRYGTRSPPSQGTSPSRPPRQQHGNGANQNTFSQTMGVGVTVLPSSLLELPFQRQFLEGSINFRLQRPEIILPLVSRVIPTKIRTILSSRSDGYIYIELIIRMPQGGAVSGWHHQGETRRVGIIKGKYINEPSSQR